MPTTPKSLGLRLILLVALTACAGDPMGPGEMRVLVNGASPDSVFVGAPGEPLASDVGLRVTDGAGAPLWGASVEWTVVGRGARLVTPLTKTDQDGAVSTGWVLGTDATGAQQLNVTVRRSGHEAQMVIHARAVPHIVTQLRVALDTPAVLRLGDTLMLQVQAVDPYGNVFPAPDVAASLVDSSVGVIAGASVIGGPRRGRTIVRALSHGIAAEFPIQVTQFVAAIVPLADTIVFSSLGAERPIAYTVRDDRGRLVADTTAAISIADTTKVRVTGSQLRSLAPGATDVHLAIGSTLATVVAGVRQRIASLTLDTVYFDALLDTTTLRSVARDSLNADVFGPTLSYQVSNAQVAKLVSGHTLSAVAPGTTVVTARDSATGIFASANVVVHQRVATVELPVAHLQFDAVGDTLSVGVAMARDRLGSVVSDAALDYSISDSAVAGLESSSRVKSVGAGQTLLTVRDAESGVTGQTVIVVDQVATSLTVTVDSAKSIVALPAGAILPLTCRAFDKNGFAITQDLIGARSVKGTVIGTTCSNARIQRSGYDTLVFTRGSVQTRVPVIVSTGDSVGVVAATQPLIVPGTTVALSPQLIPSFGVVAVSAPTTVPTRDQFVGEDVANPLILALHPLVADILAAYGNPASNLGRARAIRDWVARTAVILDASIHLDSSTSNLTVLPPGTDWADVNRFSTPAKWDEDRLYWGDQHYEGYLMLDRLLGTLDPGTGNRADDGMMVHVAGARYRIRDIQAYHYTLCSYQAIIANALWAAAGLQGMRAGTISHDPAVVFIPELGRWVYEDPTFNEEYLLDGVGDPLSPTDLLTLSNSGQASRLKPTKFVGPNFDPQVYVADRSYIKVGDLDGIVIMGSQLYNRVVGQVGWSTRYVQIDVPQLATVPANYSDPAVYDRVTATQAFPVLGVGVEQLAMEDSVYVATLSSTYPGHDHFERRTNGGSWGPVSTVDVLPVGGCRVEYRSVDSLGNVGARAVLDVWMPRAEGFLQAGPAGGTRTRSQFCN